MEYLLLVCDDPEAEPYDRDQDNIGAWVDEVQSRGIQKFGNRLRPPQDATTVRRRGDQLLVTDGPFAETREQIAGFDILDCKDLDEAIDIASRHPMARFGRIEIRPFWPLTLDETGRPVES